MSVVYRADTVGSMLRPPSLKRAWQRRQAGEISASEFKRVEDRAVDQTIAIQEGAGMDVVTDGELRRQHYMEAIHADYAGISEVADPELVTSFHGGEESLAFTGTTAITERLTRRRYTAVEEFTYARARARKPVKVTLPNPLAFAMWWHSRETADAYADVMDLIQHSAELIREEILELARLGCQYVQIDLPELTMVVDESARAEHWDRIGISTDWLLTEGMDLVNSCVKDIPEVYFGIHFCRGNYASQWISTGGYDPMAAAFSRLPDFGSLLLEYDSDRSGGFEPLRHVPEDKVVVLGLLSTKVDTLESREDIERRIDEAAEFFPRDQLALSTQCGFASVANGNNISEDTQEAKLQLVADVAHSTWAS